MHAVLALRFERGRQPCDAQRGPGLDSSRGRGRAVVCTQTWKITCCVLVVDVLPKDVFSFGQLLYTKECFLPLGRSSPQDAPRTGRRRCPAAPTINVQNIHTDSY